MLESLRSCFLLRTHPATAILASSCTRYLRHPVCDASSRAPLLLLCLAPRSQTRYDASSSALFASLRPSGLVHSTAGRDPFPPLHRHHTTTTTCASFVLPIVRLFGSMSSLEPPGYRFTRLQARYRFTRLQASAGKVQVHQATGKVLVTRLHTLQAPAGKI
jgi:hypothetical protein